MARARRELQKYFALVELLVELDNKLIHHTLDIFLAVRVEGDHGIEPIAKFRAEHLFYGFFAFAHVRLSTKSKGRATHLPRPRIRGHDQHYVAQIGLLLAVGSESRAIHHL